MKHKLAILVAVLFTAVISSAFTVRNFQSNGTLSTLNNVKVSMGGEWLIGYYFSGKSDRTETVSANSFTFNGDNSISIYRGGTFGSPGQWKVVGSTMTLGFNQSDLVSINGDWTIVSIDDMGITLQQGVNRKLVFVKNSNPGFPSDLQ